MNDFAEVTGALFVAVFITTIFYFALKSRGPWGSIWTFFFFVFLAIWAASLWFNPAGPVFLGVAWLPLLFIGFLVALLFVALPTSYDVRNGDTGTKRRKIRRSDTSEKKEISDQAEDLSGEENPDDTAVKVSGFFWVLMVFLLLAIILGYWLG
ncbi:MAG: hypothetical protein ACLFQO_07615 [Cyclobacteriaceae bacterium]